MKYISKTVEEISSRTPSKQDNENVSIVEKILSETGSEKVAAVLALDLMLVGVDTVIIICLFLDYKI